MTTSGAFWERLEVLNKLFETEFGQKILLFLAPFFLSPYEFQSKQQNSEKNTLIKHLHLSAFAPLLGAAFLTGALVAVLRTLQNKGIAIAWIVNYKSANLIFTAAAIFTWLGYSAALARHASGWLLKIIPTDVKTDFRWPLPFWLSYYGGILIVCGVFAWIVVGFLSFHFSYTSGAIALALIIALGFYLRLEIKLAQDKNRKRIHYIDWGVYNNISLRVFIVLQGLGLLAVLALWPSSTAP